MEGPPFSSLPHTPTLPCLAFVRLARGFCSSLVLGSCFNFVFFLEPGGLGSIAFGFNWSQPPWPAFPRGGSHS